MDKSGIDRLAEKFGGRFKLTVLIQKRVKELVKGAAKLVETDHKNLIDVAIEEIRQGKLQWEGMESGDDDERKPRKKEKSE